MISWMALAAAVEPTTPAALQPIVGRGPELGVHGLAGLGNNDASPLLFGGGATFAIDPWRRVHLELAADAGPTVAGDFWLGAGPRVRAFLGKPEKAVLSVFAGGGLAVDDGLRGLIDGGAALDLGHTPSLKARARPRIHADYAWSPGGSQRLLVGVGAVFGRKGVEIPVPPPEPQPEPQKLTLAEEGMIWLPGPVCEWMLPDDASAELQRLGVQLASMNVISAKTLRDPDGSAGMPPAKAEPSPGKIVVVASARDDIVVAGEAVQIEDGVAISSHPEGRVDVSIVGGGRVERWPLGVVPGTAIWLTAGEPQPVRVAFAVNQSVLNQADLDVLQGIAENAGSWSFVVHGSYSAEGSVEKNQALANKRAEAVRTALEERGVSPDHVRVAEPLPPADGLAVEQQRAAVITPREIP